ncbi:hypothetical protein TRFO_02031 [Tritrichomonas foetus]|uniref:Uncharacterized protein n=1 Tax=Tritrichomonas foetus TaxID=1144522 RepID=A0A1J4JI98_9EUKA|nr:hypothetical protein TRFO_02031 [Tritrichomonas foetus]|eukprot:OHS96916.1 hypothetical protein TRFO_02031 [Tritrichomonas foetus]
MPEKVEIFQNHSLMSDISLSIEDPIVTFQHQSKDDVHFQVPYSLFSRRSKKKKIMKLPHSFTIEFSDYDNPAAVEILVFYLNSGKAKFEKDAVLDLFCLCHYFYVYKLALICRDYMTKNISVNEVTSFIAGRVSKGLEISAFADYVSTYLKFFSNTPNFFTRIPLDFIVDIFKNAKITPDEYLNYSIDLYKNSNFNESALQILQFTDIENVSTELLTKLQKLLKKKNKPYPYFELINTILLNRDEVNMNTSDDIQVYHLEAKIQSLSNTLLKVAQGNQKEALYLISGLYESDSLVGANPKQILENYLKIATTANDKNAYFEAAERFANGVGIANPDIKKAVDLYEKASKLGHQKSCIILAQKVINGLGIPLKAQKEFEFVQSAAFINDVNSLYCLANFYRDGYGCRKSNLMAIRYYLLAHKAGHNEALNKFKDLSARSNQQTEKEAKKLIKTYFDNNEDLINNLKLIADSEYSEGIIKYINALEQLERYHEAKRYCKQAINLGFLEGVNLLSFIYMKTKKYDKAFKNIMSVKSLEIPDVYYYLSYFYKYGWGVPKNEQQMHINFQKAAELGHKISMLLVANKNNDLPAIEKIIKNYQSRSAKYYLGKMLIEGKYDGKPQVSRGVSLIKDSAENGCIDACFYYGKLLDEGELVTRDGNQANYYIKQAVNQNHQSAVVYHIYKVLLLKENKTYYNEALRVINIMKRFNNPSVRYKSGVLLNNMDDDLRQSSDSESICGMFQYGLKLLEEKKDYYEALNLFLKAGLLGLDIALYYYAINAIKFPELESIGISYLRYLSNKGHTPSQTAFGIYHYEHGNFDIAIRYLKPNAYNKDRVAEFYYGKMLMYGQGMKQDLSLALNFFRLSDSKKYGPAQNMLINVLLEMDDKIQLQAYLQHNFDKSPFIQYKYASLFFSNYFEKPEIDEDFAIDLLKLSCLYEDSNGLWKFGIFLRDGHIVAKNSQESYQYFRRSAKLGNPTGKCCLGNLLIKGNNKQKAAAFQLFKESHEANNKTGSWCYANCLKRGIGCHNQRISQSNSQLSDSTETSNCLKALSIFINLADNYNDKDSQYEVFKLLMNGVLVKDGIYIKQESKAIEYLVRAANNNHSTAQWRLGELLSEGKFFKKDEKAAAHFFKLSAEAGNNRGIWHFAKCLFDGRGVPKDMQRATKYLEKLCEKNDSDAEFMYGSYLIDKQNKIEEGIVYIIKSANSDNADALWKLGDLYMNGIGVVKDLESAKKYYEKSSDKGNFTGLYKLAEYNLFIGNLKEGSELLRRASDLGQSDAQLKLAYFFENGENKFIEKDEQKALELFKLVTDRDNNPEAMFMYGKLSNDHNFIELSAKLGNSKARIYYGKTTKNRNQLSAYYFKLVADEGDPEAQCLFGKCLKSGNGIMKDKNRSIEYFKKAAMNGNNDAKYEYGRILYKTDKTTGLKLLNEAKENGSCDALYTISKIEDNSELLTLAADKGCKKAIIKCGRHFLVDNSTNLDYFIKAAEIDGECAFHLAFSLKNNFIVKTQNCYALNDSNHPLYENMNDNTNDSINEKLKDVFKYINLSYQLGYQQSSSVLGLLYFNGEGIDKNINQALKLFNESVENNDSFGINCLGYCFYTGIGQLTNIRNAVQFFKIAADRGEPSALSNYGVTLFHGRGSEYNIQLAIKYFQMAAEKGSCVGFENLKIACEKMGIEKDFDEIEEKMKNERLLYHVELAVQLI